MLTINNTLDGYLKDVEIKGNTIQDIENLADIRSVGDKVEGQELYEIPVLSCGKNVWNVPISVFNGDKYIQTSDYSRKPGINLPQNSSWTLTFEKKSSDARLYVWKGDVLSRTIEFSWASLSQTFTLVDNEDGISFYAGNFGNSPYDIVTVDFKIQLEEGTQATPYEPYVEDKLTILSPVQLEKVGDVADRIICKDGVWGVEKNVYTATSDCFLQDSKKQLWHLSKSKAPSWISKNIWNEISNMVMCNYYGEVATYNEVLVTEGIFIDHKGVNPNIIIGTNDTNINSLPSDLITKYQLTTPQFIPLPHDQQVKLRTFANKTNISFFTEIEGTIKAQAPKSLGATVNTHTEQINNLNKELDRVKKLEESTVSTVTTESDFTTVEATTNGYFEDVKLEGKTLVNLCTRLYDQKANTVIDNGSALNYTKHPFYAQCDFKLLQNLKQNTTYTVVLNVTNFVEGMSLQVNFYKYDEWTVCSSTEYVRNKGVHTILLTTNENIADHIRIGKMNDAVESLDEYITLSKDVIILEGDHTQNPQNGYIEGLKSVGQDVDEIVVSSVDDGNMIHLDNIVKGYYLNGSGGRTHNPNSFYTNYYIRISHNNRICLKTRDNSKQVVIVALYTKNKELINNNEYTTNAIFNIPINAKYMRLSFYNRLDIKEQLYVGYDDSYNNTPHQSDKKRLLYYNNETQAWEKPILREWDSIEKHTDGKYYYHQRSAEVVLNGSENWVISTSLEKTNTIFAYINVPKNILNQYLLCNRFAYEKALDGYDVEGVRINSGVQIRISKSKLSTQDVAGFKQWLQANNVTVVYQLAQEKVYECTNIDLITYANETNYVVESGVLSPKTTLKVHSNISNVVSLLQKKVSLLESNMTKYMITQNRLQLSSTHSADSVTFKVDYTVCSENMSQENYDTDLYNLILNNILVGKDNYNYDRMFNIIMDYASWSQISWDQFDILVGIMDLQHNPPIEPPIEEALCETPEE